MRWINEISIGVLCIATLTLLLLSCKKEAVENPYDQVEVVQNDNPTADQLPVGNFAWLHQKIFKPTCANSGCHDGTFEPKFNSISSSYNTLVNHSVISNDESNSYIYRVLPGDAEASLLHARLTQFIPNTSGIMPLALEPDSDYPENSDYYIAKIDEWIIQGAKDMYGVAPASSDGDFPPQVGGLAVFPDGNTTNPFIRDPDGIGITPILVNAGICDVWLNLTDDNTAIGDMTGCSIKLSSDLNGFDNAIENPLLVTSPINALDFSNNPVAFTHKSSIDLSGASAGDHFFIRAYLDDNIQISITEIPNEGSNAQITSIFVLKVQ